MRLLSWRRIGALALAASVAAIVFAQAPSALMAEGQGAYLRKEYAKSADLYMQAYKKDAKQLLALYNAACSFALGGQKEQAMAAIEELAAKGYNRVDQLKSDTDLETLHGDARWDKAVAKIEENAKKNPPPKLWKAPYTVLTDTPLVADLNAKLGDKDTAVWLEGDVLTFLHRSKAANVHLTGGVQDPLTHIPNSDLWILRAKMDGWDKALVSYAFIEDQPRVILQTWRGENAPPAPERAKPLKGQIINRTYHSQALDEDRKLMIYLPPNAPKSDLPAVFMADGLGAKQFAEVLEPLILAHKVRPCAIVGVDSGGYRGDRDKGYDPMLDYRAREYVPTQDPERFDKHMKFFTEEVGAYAAKEFGVSTRREDRAVTGFSNGGAFSAAVAFRMPSFFGTAIPLSLGVPPADEVPSSLPQMFFAAGTLESFSLRTSLVFELVKKHGAVTSYDSYVAGHDPEMWDMAFAKIMPKVFPG